MIDVTTLESDEIVSVEGLRRWSMTIDTMYLRVRTGSGTTVICEDDVPFKAVLEWMNQNLPGFGEGWGRFCESVKEQRDLDMLVWERARD